MTLLKLQNGKIIDADNVPSLTSAEVSARIEAYHADITRLQGMIEEQQLLLNQLTTLENQ